LILGVYNYWRRLYHCVDNRSNNIVYLKLASY